ncbi:MAG: SNF2-related protein [Desulfobacterales bacterium]|nr:SNF2-related protein [Desulfobacterales bacterium]
MRWVPRSDQERALELWGERKKGALWLPTGAGKSVIAGTILADWMLDRCAIDRTMVVAPRMVVEQWRAELAKWEHLNPLHPLAGVVTFDDLGLTPKVEEGKRGELVFRDRRATKKRLKAIAAAHRIVVCSWDAFPFVEEAFGAAWPFEGLVLDESSFVRDQGSARGKAARRAVHKSGKVELLIELTATPLANKVEALRAQLDLLEPGCMGRTLTEFREQWCVPASQDRQTGRVFSWKLAGARWPEVEAIVARLAVRVPDALGVEMVVAETPVFLPDHVMREMRTLEADSVLPDVTAGSAAVVHARLRQISAGAVYLDAVGERGPVRHYHTAKLDRLRELLDEVDGEQVLVAYNWEFEREVLTRAFGADFADIRERGAKERFERGELQVLGIHPASAGHGVDGLQHACRRMVWMSVPEDFELFTQANGRLRRGGQKRTVFVHVLVAVGTREDRVWRSALPQKEATQDRVLTTAQA